MQVWPADKTKRSLDWQSGLSESNIRYSEYKIYEKSARDIGPPGCPEFALPTPSITRPFIILTVNWSFSSLVQSLNVSMAL